ncbi:hypothetical protein [Sulfuracidifex tepidarius]|uniref:Uncharacterized protein n=1 Tax=Sulfuracidifex tepidarius TaxID=1294262 RepID=A0A510E6W1_9CREN|nr:hypothetical protein IC006_2815 [Sulfuracidifex tepidarius]BBG28273.1 hypothetical protein IC007_2829 [Sulfuracidifex tepidarius]
MLLGRAKEVIDKCESEGVTLRLIGGAAIAIIAEEGSKIFSRQYKDADYFGISNQSSKISSALEKIGMTPNKRFNALHGSVRLMFYDPVLETTIDIFLDEFNMCHKIILKNRLNVMKYTIPTSDLLLSKMQIVKITENDYKDILALLHDVNIGDKDDEHTLNVNYIAKLLSDDWGFYKTFSINVDNVKKYASSSYPDYFSSISKKLDEIMEHVEKHPKSMKWKMRSKVGEKVKWYEEPEDVNTNFMQNQ